MKKAFYWVVRNLCLIASYFYFRGVEINGREGIPSDGALLYAPNHQNAFLDAILIGIYSPSPVSYFTRGDIFVKPYVWFLEALNMLPVFRAKDGFKMAAQNDKTFETAVKTLLNDQPLMIFPEANHDYPYTLRTLTKGTARVAISTQEQSKKPVYIIPVGLNYFRRHSVRFKLIINYGRPILIEDYMDEYSDHKAKALNRLRGEMTKGLKEQMVIPELDEHYEKRALVFTRSNEPYQFSTLKEKAQKLDTRADKSFNFLKPLVGLLSIVNFVPIGLSKYIVSQFKDPVFVGSMKFGIAALFCPIWYLILFVLLGLFLGWKISIFATLSSILVLILTYELKRLYTITEHHYYTIWERPNVKK